MEDNVYILSMLQKKKKNNQEALGPHSSPEQQFLIIKKLELIYEVCNIDLWQIQ